MMKKFVLSLGTVLLLVGGGALAFAVIQTSAKQPDCTGTIVCPITGEEICPCCCPLAQ